MSGWITSAGKRPSNPTLCRLIGESRPGSSSKTWSATAFPVRVGNQIVLVTTAHSLLRASSCELSRVADRIKHQTVDLRINPEVWIPARIAVDLSYTIVDPEIFAGYEVWESHWSVSDPTGDPEEFSLIAPSIAPAPVRHARLGRYTGEITFGVTRRFEVDGLDEADEHVYAVDFELPGSGTPVFLEDAEGLSFAGLVTHRLDQLSFFRITRAKSVLNALGLSA